MRKLRYLRGNGAELIFCKQSAISYPLHNHVSVYTLGLVLDGAVELITDKGIRLCREKDIFVIFPYIPHRISAKPSYTLLSLCVRSDLIANLKTKDSKSEIASFLHDTINQPDIEARLIQTLNSLAYLCPMVPTQKDTAICHLRSQLEMYPETKYSVDEMAEAALISKYHFIRTFKHEVGLTPHQFQIQNRIRKAQKMLEQSVTVTEVALAAGFCDQSHFIRSFEKLMGLTPTDYRQACEIRAPLFCDRVSAGINLANKQRPSGPALTSCGSPLGRIEITPGS